MKKNNLKKDYQGFTLIELLLYIAVMAILILIIFNFLTLSFQAKNKNQTIAEVEQQGLNISYLLSQNIKTASAITAPTTGLSSTTLSLSSTDINKNPTIFRLAGNILTVNFAGGANLNLNNNRVNVSNFICYNLTKNGAPDSISCRFTLSAVDPYNRPEYTYMKNYNISASHRY